MKHLWRWLLAWRARRDDRAWWAQRERDLGTKLGEGLAAEVIRRERAQWRDTHEFRDVRR